MFHTELKVKAIRGTGDRELLESLVYETCKGLTLVVPMGFKTNYASIPKFLRWFIDQDGPEIRDISVVHDYLYSNRNVYKINRRQADAILYQGMREAGAGWIKAALVWLAVRIFGGLHQKMIGSSEPGEDNQAGQFFSFFAVVAVLLILLPLILSGCIVTGIAKDKARQYVQAYCGNTEAERQAFRTMINEATYPNKINLECVDGKTHG